MSEKKFTAIEIIEKILQEHNGQAPLGLIYREFEEKWADKSNLQGKTPRATLRERVQTSPKFKRIEYGVYALLNAQPPSTPEAKTEEEKQEREHSDIQGMLIEIGNHLGVDTYTPDKKKLFLGQTPLGSFTTIEKISNFTHDNIVKSTRGVDVLWFNNRKIPTHAFEVEHTTDFRGALTKFCELQDFHVDFYCVSESSREEKFKRELERAAFSSIKERCEFLSYAYVERLYRGIDIHQEFKRFMRFSDSR